MAVPQSSPYLHNPGSGDLGQGHLGMLSAEVPLQLALGGESCPQSSQMKVLSVCLSEVLAGAVALQGPGERKAMEQHQQGWEPAGESLSEPGLGQPGPS